MFLFQKDLLPALARNVLSGKSNREGRNIASVPWYWKVISWALIAIPYSDWSDDILYLLIFVDFIAC
jgi:hypothetical protein